MFNFQELLPQLPEENTDKFHNDTLKLLLTGQNLNFGNPINQFKMKLINGKYSDNHWRKKEIVEKYRAKKRKLMLVTQHFSHLNSEVPKPSKDLSHIKKLGRSASKKLKTMNLDERVGKRQITELRRIRLEVQEKGDSSDDEEFIQELMNERDRKMAKLKSLQDWQGSNHKKLPELPPLESINTPNLPKLEEIPKCANYETSYFSLLRFFFCQTETKSLTIPELMELIKSWELTVNRSLINWIDLAKTWVAEIPSAIAFLGGAFPHASPPGFVPIITCNNSTGYYTWISDVEDLSMLTTWWLERRQICQAVTSDNTERGKVSIFVFFPISSIWSTWSI